MNIGFRIVILLVFWALNSNCSIALECQIISSRSDNAFASVYKGLTQLSLNMMKGRTGAEKLICSGDDLAPKISVHARAKNGEVLELSRCETFTGDFDLDKLSLAESQVQFSYTNDADQPEESIRLGLKRKNQKYQVKGQLEVHWDTTEFYELVCESEYQWQEISPEYEEQPECAEAHFERVYFESRRYKEFRGRPCFTRGKKISLAYSSRQGWDCDVESYVDFECGPPK